MRKDPTKLPIQKKDPKTPLYIVIIIWLIFALLMAFDIYELCTEKDKINATDLFCDLGVLAVAIYFNVKYVKDKKNNKKQS